MEDKLFQKKDGMAMESSLSAIISNIYMQHSEELALGSEHQLSLRIRCVKGIFIFWPHGSERLQNILSHLNSLRPSFQFTMETE
jgi:hypothetical protein